MDIKSNAIQDDTEPLKYYFIKKIIIIIKKIYDFMVMQMITITHFFLSTGVL